MSTGVNLRVLVCGNVAQDFWHVPEHIKFVHVHLEKARIYSLLVQCVCQTAAGPVYRWDSALPKCRQAFNLLLPIMSKQRCVSQNLDI